MTNRHIAAELGLKFFSAKECKRCGCTVRYTASGGCVDCAKTKAAAYSSKIRDKLAKPKG